MVVTAHHLVKKYAHQTVVSPLSFGVQPGECWGILGPNGAGKTTTLKMLTGNTRPSSGYLEVLGYPIPGQARRMRTKLGVVPQKDNLDPDFSVVENLYVYGRYFGLSHSTVKQRMPSLLKLAALEHKAQARVPTLSGGMQRRLSLARALINEPALLILDEPTTGLDPQARQLMWQQLLRLKNEGLTSILTTHYMEEAERLCDRLIILDNGQVLETGSPQELIAKHIAPQVVEVYGQGVESWHTEQGCHLHLHSEPVGDSRFYYGPSVELLLQNLERTHLRYLHRRANLEDVFLKLTGRDLRDA